MAMQQIEFARNRAKSLVLVDLDKATVQAFARKSVPKAAAMCVAFGIPEGVARAWILEAVAPLKN